jgi:hypothetical protein
MNAKRGYVPEDEKNFSAEAIQVMQKASRPVPLVFFALCVTVRSF